MGSNKSSNNLPEYIAKILKAKGVTINTERFAHTLLDKFGGDEGLANEVHALYHSDASNAIKTRLLVAAMEFMNKATYKNPPKPVQDTFSTDELEAFARELMRRASEDTQHGPVSSEGSTDPSGTGGVAGQPPT